VVLTGHARRVGGDLTPEAVIDAETAATGDPALLAARCVAAADPSFAERCGEGDLLVLDGALLGGPGAEAAVIALQAVGVAAAVCAAADPALAELAAGYGLPLLAAPQAAAAIPEGAVVRLDLERGQIEADGQRWACSPLDPPALAAARRAQLLARMRRVVEDEGYAE
jgi:3-isopropylmalate/(R)-2-methylmalate dehydratase small subunit